MSVIPLNQHYIGTGRHSCGNPPNHSQPSIGETPVVTDSFSRLIIVNAYIGDMGAHLYHVYR